MERQYYYAQNGQQLGPVSISQLQRMLSSGQLSLESLVWTAGMPQWTRARDVQELGVAGRPPQMPPDLRSMPRADSAEALQGIDPRFSRPAGFWKRVGASLLDSLITSVIGGICGGIVGGVIGGVMAANGNTDTDAITAAVTPAVWVLSILIGWLYFAIQESSARQATFGKRALGIVVTSANGQRISFGQASGRYFGKILSGLLMGIGFLMVAFTEKKEGLHDRMAGCLVVRRSN